MNIIEMIEQNKIMIEEQLAILYKAHQSLKDDWRFGELNLLRQKRIDELEEMRKYYDDK